MRRMKKLHVTKKRGALLTIWLILMLVFFGASALAYFLLGVFITQFLPNAFPWFAIALGVISTFNFALTYFLSEWKRWAFFGFIPTFIATLVVSVLIELSFLFIVILSISSVANILILFLLIRPRWNYFESKISTKDILLVLTILFLSFFLFYFRYQLYLLNCTATLEERLAVTNYDINTCDQCDEYLGDKDICLVYVAVKKQDSSICGKITSQKEKNICYYILNR
jgi:glucan phosphoethanolaminetransferase (alkaline phosphatase superfamily)